MLEIKPKLSYLKAITQEISQEDSHVLIEGEVGTGKEYTAINIHRNSIRKNQPFITVNINTILLARNKNSYFEKAFGGTLYLDGIENLELASQEDLFQILSSGKIDLNKSQTDKLIDVRIIASSKKNLQKEAEKGLFLPHLYKTLSPFILKLPPLREYNSEIIDLSEIFILEYCKKNRKPIKHLSQGAKEILLSYNYPQNIRELKAIIELSLMMSEGQIIYPEDIYLKQNFLKEDLLSTERTLQEYEAMIISYFLRKYDNKVYYVADKLGISKNKIYSLINQGLIKRD
jgi:DNA-binding NtrC family response regulator